MLGMQILDENQEAVEELKMRMKNALTPVLDEDSSLFYRFLKARDFDVQKAEKMLSKHITWRKINQTDTILEDFRPKEFFTEYIQPSVIGYDKNGDLVAYSAAGKVNVNEIFKCVKINDYMKHWMWFGEKNIASVNEHIRETGKYSYQVTLIMDLDELTFTNATSRLTVNAFLRFVGMYQDNYPERMKSLYVINAPSYYIFLYAVLKTVMSSAMIRKIHLFAKSGWKEKLLEIVDADVLPAFLGGNRTDPDGNPLCRTFINFGGKIPENYFLSDEERYFLDKTRVSKVLVPAMAKEEVYVDVKEIGCILQWEFLVKGKDIGFGILFQVSKEEIIQIIPAHKYETSDGTERGCYKCRYAGTYIIIFDNSHSWLNSKELEYCMTILNPEQWQKHACA